jgi:NodT family efflux transporter outer membrane factor (OMF) lipoprotein
MIMTTVAMRLALASLGAATTLGACAAVPVSGPPAKIAPVEAYQDQKSFSAPSGDWPTDRWWEAYGDPQLTALIDEALTTSPTLAEAEARMASAESATAEARAALLPQLSGQGSVSEVETSRTAFGFPPFVQQLLPQGYHDEGLLALNASIDLDLFGKNRAALAAAGKDQAAVLADLAEARLTLAAAVATAYADLARLGAERAAAEEAVRNRQETSRLTAERVANGLDTRGELRQAQAATPASQADVQSLDEQIDITRHRIAALIGAGPDRGLSIAVPGPEAVKPLALPADLRLHLIGRRPDIVAARLRAEEAAKRIDVARAQFFPDVTLTGEIGQQALGLSQLFDPASAFGSVGPAVTLPIFEGGRLRAQYHGAQADYAYAVAAYDATLAQALQDVADTVASVKSAEAQLAERKQALDAGEEGYRVAEERYRGGLSSFVSVLAAEDAIINERRAYADAAARAFSLDIALVRALGGGYVESARQGGRPSSSAGG